MKIKILTQWCLGLMNGRHRKNDMGGRLNCNSGVEISNKKSLLRYNAFTESLLCSVDSQEVGLQIRVE